MVPTEIRRYDRMQCQQTVFVRNVAQHAGIFLIPRSPKHPSPLTGAYYVNIRIFAAYCDVSSVFFLFIHVS